MTKKKKPQKKTTRKYYNVSFTETEFRAFTRFAEDTATKKSVVLRTALQNYMTSNAA